MDRQCPSGKGEKQENMPAGYDQYPAGMFLQEGRDATYCGGGGGASAGDPMLPFCRGATIAPPS